MYKQPKSVICPKCGSTHCYKAEYQQFRGWCYSSTSGGELSSQGTVITVLVCLCGYPVETTGVRCLAPNERETFQHSLASARRYRDEVEAESVKDRLRATFAERSELAATAKQVVHLHKIIEGMTKDFDEANTGQDDARTMPLDSPSSTPRRSTGPNTPSQNQRPERRN